MQAMCRMQPKGSGRHMLTLNEALDHLAVIGSLVLYRHLLMKVLAIVSERYWSLTLNGGYMKNDCN